MRLSTHGQMELYEVVADKLSELAAQQGKQLDAGYVFELLFGGDYCDIFDTLLEALQNETNTLMETGQAWQAMVYIT